MICLKKKLQKELNKIIQIRFDIVIIVLVYNDINNNVINYLLSFVETKTKQ